MIAQKRERNRPRVVIIGGSFAGLTALSHLSHSSLVDVVVVDPKNYFEYSPGILVCLSGSRLDRIISPLSPMIEAAQGQYLQGRCLSVCPQSKSVQIQNPEGEISLLDYDALLFCCGIPYSLPIKSNITDNSSRKEDLSQFSRDLKTKKSILILGGGLIGVELAAELCSMNFSFELTIITSDGRLLPTLPVSAGNKAHKWLVKQKVNIIYNERVSSISADLDSKLKRLVAKSGKVYLSDCVFNCTGNSSLTPSSSPNSISKSDFGDLPTGYIPLSSMVSSRSTIVVDSSFKPVQGALMNTEGIFVCGDMADIVTPNIATSSVSGAKSSWILPPWAAQLGKDVKSGFIADVQAEIAARNILLYCNQLSSPQPSVTYCTFPEDKFLTSTAPLISCVTLGPTNGILLFNNIVLGGEGFLGYLISRAKLIIEISKIAELRHQLWAR